jgi:Ni,Fe-hydrogenase III large subunit
MWGAITLRQYLNGGRQAPVHHPWPRYLVDEEGWTALVHQLAISDWVLLGLWGDSGEVHAALKDEDDGGVAVVSLACADRAFPTLSLVRPSSIRLERTVRDLYGLNPIGLEDRRPWLDHGRWPNSTGPLDYQFLKAEGDNLHQIPVGPVHAGVIEPGHFRFSCAGETIVRLEERLGYTHKGLESLMSGKTVGEAARLVGRVSGDSTVAYAIAFARAVEAATSSEAPARAHWLRALMAELERLANHLLDFGAVCNDVAFGFMLAQCTVLRERILDACQFCFGHRLMMDCVVPGGVTVDLTREGTSRLREVVRGLRKPIKALSNLYDDLPSLQDRMVGTGIVTPALAHRFGVGGFVARASSRGGDARKDPGYPPYAELEFNVPLHLEGDVNARVWVRLEEMVESLRLIEQILERMPGGPKGRPIPTRPGEGMALVEGFRGEILVWVRLSEVGRVVRCHPRDPSWFQWPLLEAAIENNIVADFPLCNKSFNCSYSGVDL